MGAIRRYAWNLIVLPAAALLLTVPLWLPPKVFSLLDDTYPHDARLYADNVNGGASEVLWLNQAKLNWQCRVREGAAQRMCGFQLAFPQGIDLRQYIGLRMRLQVHSKNAFLRVSTRNFAAEFSRAEDIQTTQFNQVLVPLEDFAQPVLFKFNEFAVAEWWLQKFDVPRQFSYPHFDQVVAIGIEIGNPPEVADHEFELQSLELVGAWFEAEHWYLALLIGWLSAIFIFGFWQILRTHYGHMRDKKLFRQMANSDPKHLPSSSYTVKDTP